MTPSEQLDFLDQLFADAKPMLNAYADLCEDGKGKHDPEEVDEIMTDMDKHLSRLRRQAKS